MKIKNGVCNSNFGRRQIVFSPNGEVRPVETAVWSGYIADCGTVQIAYRGDYLVRFDWGKKWRELRFEKFNADGSTSPVDCIPFTVPIELFQWLYDGTNGKQPSFLPEWYGWDGQTTLASTRKSNRIRKLFEGTPEEWLTKIVSSAFYSPASSLPSNFKNADPLPEVLDAPAYTWSGSMVDIEQWTEWVLWYEDGHVEVVRPAPTSGQWGSNYAHESRGEYNSAPLPMPENVVKAARVSRGVYIKNNCSYGVSWKLFKKE